jgi:glycerol-1-phosphate dehydrogenase [NAD(P)+]
MSFINIIRSLEFSSDGILKSGLLEGIFIGSDEDFASPKNFLALTQKEVLGIASKFTEAPELMEKPTLEKAVEIAGKLNDYDGILAIGSGSVFDVAKHAAALANKPLIGFCTALSMNGYLSSTASLYENGMKKSFKGKLPQKLYFDLEILKNAPIDLTKAGFGDSLARISAQNDCKLSHKIKGTPYPVELFDFRLPSEEFLLQNYKLLEAKDDEFFLQLLENILFSGLAMHLHGSSFPASGGEHAMAHFAESKFPSVAKFWHGLQISAFTCEMLDIQKEFPEHAPEILEYNLKKIFKELKMPSSFADLGLTSEDFELIKIEAKNLRERYGFLHLIK